jgi:hypothetical protein
VLPGIMAGTPQGAERLRWLLLCERCAAQARRSGWWLEYVLLIRHPERCDTCDPKP